MKITYNQSIINIPFVIDQCNTEGVHILNNIVVVPVDYLFNCSISNGLALGIDETLKCYLLCIENNEFVFKYDVELEINNVVDLLYRNDAILNEVKKLKNLKNSIDKL